MPPYDSMDSLWPHFLPLWTDLRTVASKLLLAGGYGLFLKQRWLLTQTIQTLVPLNRWQDVTPRVTKDLDIIAELKVIASPEDQRQIDDVLNKHGFKVRISRWQFFKNVGPDKDVILDILAPVPPISRNDLRVGGESSET